MTKELVPLVPKPYSSTNLFGMRNFTGAVNGTGTMALDLVQVLENLTWHRNLRFLTLLTWTNIFPQRKLLRSVKAWCPDCYREWHSQRKVIYDPLIWHLEIVKVCSHHRKYLSTQCPSCNQKLPLLCSNLRSGYCPQCDRWLGIKSDSTAESHIEIENREWHLWVTKTIGELFTIAPTLSSAPDRSIIAHSFCQYIQQATEGNIAAFARKLGVPKNKVWMWQKSDVLPQLDILLKICYQLELSLCDFLNTKAIANSVNNITSSTQNRSVIDFKKPQSKPFDLLQIQQQLEEILKGSIMPPPPMTEVAKLIGYDKRVIHRHFPVLCRSISAKYLAYKKDSRFQRIQSNCKEVREIVKKLYAEGFYPTEALVGKFLKQPGAFRDKDVRLALREARREIRLEP